MSRFAAKAGASQQVSLWGKKPYTGVVFPQFVHQVNTDFTVGAVAHTKTAWVEIVPATSTDVSLLIVDGRTFTSGAETSYLIDYAVGPSGSETAIIENVFVGLANGYIPRFVPISIPIGSRLSARVQSNRTSETKTFQTKLYAGRIDGLKQTVDVLGTSTATSRATIVANINTWTQIVASTSRDYQSLIVCGSAISSAITDFVGRTTLGVGASGSEVGIAVAGYIANTAEICVGASSSGPALDESGVVSLLTEQYFGFVAAGSRLSLRTSAGAGVAGGFIIGIPA